MTEHVLARHGKPSRSNLVSVANFLKLDFVRHNLTQSHWYGLLQRRQTLHTHTQAMLSAVSL